MWVHVYLKAHSQASEPLSVSGVNVSLMIFCIFFKYTILLQGLPGWSGLNEAAKSYPATILTILTSWPQLSTLSLACV